MFDIKGRDYGIQNAWFRNDPEQLFEESRRRLRKQKLNPPEEQKAMAALHKTLQSLMEKEEINDDAIPSLIELVPRVRTKFKFIYDFGDWWEHTVQVEKIQPAAPEETYPRCIAGEGADPIEDCGGCWDFVNVMKALGDPQRPRNEQTAHIITNIMSADWDYSNFSVSDVNERIRKMLRTRESDPE